MMACIFCFTRLSHGHPSKADGAICSRLDGKDTYCKLEQSQNAERSISLTPSGISMRFRFLHWLNVPEDIFFIPFSIKTPFKELHRLKADDPISFTEPGINTWYILSQPAKALSPIFCILSGIATNVGKGIRLKALSPISTTSWGILVVIQPVIILWVAVSMMALQSFRESYTGFLGSTEMEVQNLHPQNAPLWILVMLAGMVILLIMLLPNAEGPISLMLPTMRDFPHPEIILSVAVSTIALHPSRESYVLFRLSTIMLSSERHPWNWLPSSMKETFWGIWMLRRLIQSAKVPPPLSISKVCGNFMYFKRGQFLNIPDSISTTPSGIVILSSFRHPLKASAQIRVTPCGIWVVWHPKMRSVLCSMIALH